MKSNLSAILFSVLSFGCSNTSPGADAGRDTGLDACMSAQTENTTLLCSDGCSNDSDTFIDCNDFDCCDVVQCPATTACGRSGDGGRDGGGRCPGATSPENTAQACSDGCSNDGDNFVDCNDFDCCNAVACGPSTACGRRDGGGGNRCDGASMPENTVQACSDGCSNDGDNFADCEEFDCCNLVTCGATTACGGRETECSDNMDNDDDTFIDCEDSNCCNVRSCAAGTFCGDLPDAGPPADAGSDSSAVDAASDSAADDAQSDSNG